MQILAAYILIVDDLHPVFKERAIAQGYEVDDRLLITSSETMDIIIGYAGSPYFYQYLKRSGGEYQGSFIRNSK